MTSRGWMVAMAAACLAAVGAALVAQHVYDMQPCPWCILQRLIFVAIAGVAIVVAILPVRVLSGLGAMLIALLALAGGAAAVWQHAVAAQSASCNLTFADRVLSTLGLNRALPDVFEPRASCADAAVDLFGVPFEFWSLALFALLLVASILSMRRRRRA